LCLDLTGAAVNVIAFDQALASGGPASLETAVAHYRAPLREECMQVWVLRLQRLRNG
jgi:hypothetical protein